MNTKHARKIMNLAARLTEYVATFQARHGRGFIVTMSSPTDVRELYEGIFETQVEIAQLLDTEALTNPHHKCGEWWERNEIPDTGVVQEMVNEISHLIACCAYFNTDSRGMEGSYAVRSAQSTIAGLLHPASRERVLDALLVKVPVDRQ